MKTILLLLPIISLVFGQLCFDEVFSCTSYNYSTTQGWSCDACETGYDLVSRNNCQAKIKCSSGQIIRANRCQAPLPNCQEYNQVSGQCSRCANNYIVLSNGECHVSQANCMSYNLVNGDCVSCQNNYLLLASKVCQPFKANCLSHDNQDGSCIECKDDYILLSNGNCQAQKSNCLTYGSNGLCTKCDNGYTLVNGNCLQSLINCQQLNSNGNCIKCNLNYVLVGSICQDKVKHCTQYDTSSQCIQCDNNYVLASALQSCVHQEYNCASYNNNGQCIKCNSGYTLSNKLCFKTVPSSIITIQNAVRFGNKNIGQNIRLSDIPKQLILDSNGKRTCPLCNDLIEVITDNGIVYATFIKGTHDKFYVEFNGGDNIVYLVARINSKYANNFSRNDAVQIETKIIDPAALLILDIFNELVLY